MTPLEDAVPMRWPSGPLEIARRETKEKLASETRQTLGRWHHPAALDILQDSPVDCLVLSWAAGLPQDAVQQQTAAPLIEAARERGLAVVGWVDDTGDPRAAITAAKAAGLSAVAVRNFKGGADIPVITWGNRAGVPWESTAPVLPILDNVWPGVGQAAGGAGASAGPTSLPWQDSNGWYIQLARARTPVSIWLMLDPPGKGAVVPAQSYLLAVCDTESAGARWVISFDDAFRTGLAEQNGESLKTWKRIAAAASFFRKHSDWRAFRPMALVGVISDFAGPNLDVSGEILNLMARRDLLFRVIWKSQAAVQPFAGLKVLLYADDDRPRPELRQKVMSFVEQGGTLIAGPKWGPEGKPVAGDMHPRFDLRAIGKGRLALAKESMADPYQIAGDTQILLSHANDLVKIYNGASTGCTNYTASADGRKALLQVLSYASARQPGKTSVWLRQKYHSARLWRLNAASPTPVDLTPAEDFPGLECHLSGSAESYMALEFEG